MGSTLGGQADGLRLGIQPGWSAPRVKKMLRSDGLRSRFADEVIGRIRYCERYRLCYNIVTILHNDDGCLRPPNSPTEHRHPPKSCIGAANTNKTPQRMDDACCKLHKE